MPKAMLIDVTKCMACRGCQVACKQWNGLKAETTTNRGTYENPPGLSGSTWTHIEFRETYDEWLFRKHQCMHCTNASCVSVCPTGAAHYEGEFVIIDQEVCIGCGYCVTACPYGAPKRDEHEGTARKCVFCIDRVTNGLEPACAKTCPTGAIKFGERRDLIVAGHKRVQELVASGKGQATLYGETELGGLHMMYVLDKPASVYGLPGSPQLATSNVFAQWLGGVITAGVVAAVPFWLLFRRKKEMETAQKS